LSLSLNMKITRPHHIKSIADFHRLRKLAPPEHPLISLVKVEELAPIDGTVPLVMDFYSIAVKRGLVGKMRYGQQSYDFDEGVMFFVAPGQRFHVEHHDDSNLKGLILLVHPDLLWNTPLAGQIKKFEYFTYNNNEALFLSNSEEDDILHMLQKIRQEYESRIDKFSSSVIIAQLELILTYCHRYYERQFLFRKPDSHKVLDQLEALLITSLRDQNLPENGIPTVQYVAEALHMSTGYLSSLLKSFVGMGTQQFIHEKVVDLAKEMLSSTDLSASEIAYKLGFTQPQSFSRLFKTKTGESPLKFRMRFN
jgi:AraC family transcriptional activator of pobA